MSDPRPVPEAPFSIPDHAPPEVKLHMRAQMIIQTAFYAFGNPETRPGMQTLNADDFLEVLNMAMAMVLSTDKSLKTPQAVRLAAADQAKRIREFMAPLQGDATVEQMLATLGMTRSASN